MIFQRAPPLILLLLTHPPSTQGIGGFFKLTGGDDNAADSPADTNDVTNSFSSDRQGQDNPKQIIIEDDKFWDLVVKNQMGSFASTAPPSKEEIQLTAPPSQRFAVFGTPVPTEIPSLEPTKVQTQIPTEEPTPEPTFSLAPSDSPSTTPTVVASYAPTGSTIPSSSPTTSMQPSRVPTISHAPSNVPTSSSQPSNAPSVSQAPSDVPTVTATDIPTAEPSETPSSSPTTSLKPSSNPTESAQPSGTPTFSSAPSETPSASPTPFPTSLPTKEPSMEPTSSQNPSSSPTTSSSPSLIPTMTMEPSSAPSVTFSPSESPSTSPSKSPTDTPSATPSSVPTSTPSASPTNQCQLGLQLKCNAPLDVSPDESCSFDFMQPPGCKDQPTQMMLRYNGGDCSQSFNLQGSTFFTCEDYSQGPPSQKGTLSYVTVYDYGGNNGNAYFQDFVAVNDDFVISGAFSANLNITIYDPKAFTDVNDIVRPKNIIQTTVFHTTCPSPDENLFLKDRFGAIQLVEFQNILQGRISCFQDLTLSYEISSNTEVELLHMGISTNIDNINNRNYDVTGAVAGASVGPSNIFRDVQIFTIDLGSRNTYTVNSSVIGTVDVGGHLCKGFDNIEFTAGGPSLPTFAPTIAPSTSSFPSPDPLTAECDLGASISCKRLSGGSCNDLRSPANKTCIGSSAEELSFIYLPSSMCAGTNSQTRFACADVNAGIPRPFTAYLKFYRGATIFFAGAVSSGQLFQVPIPAQTNEIQVEVSTVSASGGAGTRLQNSEMSVVCRQEDGLTLLDTFGHLQLTGFRNIEMGNQQVFTNIEMSYVVTNEGRHLDADLKTATTDSPFSGIDEVLKTTDPARLIVPGGVETFIESFQLNLAASAGSSFELLFDIEGQGTLSRKSCLDDVKYTLEVQS